MASSPKRKAPPETEARPPSSWNLRRRKDGATLAEIAQATDWHNHSMRGIISGQVTKLVGSLL